MNSAEIIFLQWRVLNRDKLVKNEPMVVNADERKPVALNRRRFNSSSDTHRRTVKFDTDHVLTSSNQKLLPGSSEPRSQLALG